VLGSIFSSLGWASTGKINDSDESYSMDIVSWGVAYLYIWGVSSNIYFE
jgi:hypothetical protein